MIGFEQALVEILSNTPELGRERVYFESAIGRILQENIKAEEDIPSFTNSAMDGFAVIGEDIKNASFNNPVKLDIIGTESAGALRDNEVKRGTAVKIFTGGALPKGADTVVPVEYAEEREGKVFIFKEFKRGANLRYRGEEIKKGEVLLKKGTEITPYEIGLLAQLNKVYIWVNRKPRVAILSTGSELLEVGETKKQENLIRSSNNYMLRALIERTGGEAIHLGIVKDDPEEIKKILGYIENYDIFIATGGISKGEKDFVKEIIYKLDIKIKFHGVLIKPAKPILFAITNNQKLFFGLPGNPVSSAVAFDMFVYPAIRKMMGSLNVFPEKFKAKLLRNFSRKSADRKEFLRVRVWFQEDGAVCDPLEKQGSHMLTSMTEANAYAFIDRGINELKAGDFVEVVRFK